MATVRCRLDIDTPCFNNLVDITKKLNLTPSVSEMTTAGRLHVATKRGIRKISSGTPLYDVRECKQTEGTLDESVENMNLAEKLDYVINTMVRWNNIG